MSYIVLARKYRPQNFDEVVGQSHITDLLKSAIQTDRLGSAYLFCGPRGSGKTSCARILAKSLNCKNGPTLKPCEKCPACLEITQSTSFDVIEIDGASNRGIDEIRTLRENAKFAPNYGRYKIYIVDEVHMLTTEAFNALLKTLEEPPPHVKFIFATTAPNKVPSTIVSRCQRFDFRRISISTIIETLAAVSKKEKLKIEEEALFAVAKSASGSLRDALSTLDQLSALNQKGIKVGDVVSMLGLVETELLFELADCLARKDCAGAFKVFDKIISQGKDIKQFNRDIIEHFRNLMVIQVGGKTLSALIDYPVAIKEMMLSQSQKFTLQEILNAIEVFIETQETARIMDSARIPLEIAFAKLTYQPEGNSSKAAGAEKTFIDSQPNEKNFSKKGESIWSSPLNVLSDQKGHVNFSSRESTESKKEEISGKDEKTAVSCVVQKDSLFADKKKIASTGMTGDADSPSSVAPIVSENQALLTVETVRQNWDAVTHAISRKKMSVATFLQEGSPHEIKGMQLTIGFPMEAVFSKESLEQKESLQLVERIFSEFFKTNVQIFFKIVEDHKPLEHEPKVKTTLETFKGKVVNKWHKE